MRRMGGGSSESCENGRNKKHDAERQRLIRCSFSTSTGRFAKPRTYEGNVEEGLARYKAKIGRQPCEYGTPAPEDIDQGSKHVIPDFARWVAGERGTGGRTLKD